MTILYTILSIAFLVGFYIIVKTILNINENQQAILKSMEEQNKSTEKRSRYVDALVYDIKQLLKDQSTNK